MKKRARNENNNIETNSEHIFYKRIENTTNIAFNNEETSLLNKGLKHSITVINNKKRNKMHLLDIENAILKTASHQQEDIRTLIIDEIKKSKQNIFPPNQTEPLNVLNNIQKKLSDNNAMVTKADKGNTIVIMYIQEYDRKIIQYVDDNNIRKLPNDPTNRYLKDINAAISRSNHILNKRQIYHSKMIKPKAPEITGLPKVHKPNHPIRPLINYTTSPAYKIAKILNKWLNTHIKFINNYSVCNNLELVDKIQSVKIPFGAKLASFDVTNMYSNIPVEDTIIITADLLSQTNIKPEIIAEVLELLKIVTKQNYFQHKGIFYTQNDGLPMGSPLSGTLANIYLNNIENNHILNVKNRFMNNIIYWHRYVDDVLVLFKGTSRQLDNLHNYINNIHTNIKFTLEVESCGTINFLDLSIKNVDQNHIFKIYRKPTQTDHTIHNTSNHPHQHKFAAYRHLLDRLNNIPMINADYEEEFRTIKHIANCNGYNPLIIEKMNSKIKNKIYLHSMTTLYQQQNENAEKKYITVGYNKSTSNAMKRILHKHGYTTAFRTHNKLIQKLREPNNKDEMESGVYKLTCNDCSKFYLGQTGRSFSIRFKEHTDEVNNTHVKTVYKSNYAQHLSTNHHSYTDINTNLQIIHRFNKGDILDRMEEYEIYKQRNNAFLLNDKINTKTNKLYDLIMGKI